MSIPKYPKFKVLEPCDRMAIQEWFRKYPQTTCEMNFTNLYVWRNFDHNKLTIINDNLCIHCTPPNEPAFFFAPIGITKIQDTIKTCLEAAPRLSRIPDNFVNKHISNKKNYKIMCDRKNFDYAYLSSSLAELKGKKFDGKRNHIKKFNKKYIFEYKKLTKADHKACVAVLKDWESKKKHLTDLAIKSQGDAINQLFDKFDELSIMGGGLVINGKIEAFSLASKLSPEMADVHIEIANPDYQGIFPTINNEFVKRELLKYKYINREQDLGLAGMRKAKLSYHPDHMERKFDIIKA